MEFLVENFHIIVTSGLLIILVLLMSLIISTNKVNTHITNKKFKLVSYISINPNDKNESVVMKVFNNNINDVRITSIGFVYKNQNIDYFDTLLINNNLNVNNIITIQSRDFIEFNIESNDLKELLLRLNNDSRKLSRLYAYIIDSSGLTTNIKAKDIKKHLKKLIKNEHKLKVKILRAEKKEFRKEKKTKKRLKRKEFWSKVKIKFKTLGYKVKRIFKKKK